MIKTDKVVYRTRTLEEYDWLMKKLDEAGCMWVTKKTRQSLIYSIDMIQTLVLL